MAAAATRPARCSLAERQQHVIDERGLAKTVTPRRASLGEQSDASTSTPSGYKATLGPSQSFFARQDDLLAKTGRTNATRVSRHLSSFPADDSDGGYLDDGKSQTSRVSKAPSLHPSAGGFSHGLSECTIGAGDNTAYWDFQHRKVEKKDLGHTCRECKQTFRKLGDGLTERRGARISMKYHAECFSGYADPRSQARSSQVEGTLAGTQMDAAPDEKTSTKMRTSNHFDTGRMGGGLCGKHGAAIAMGHNGFGSKTSKGKVVPTPQRAPGGFTEHDLAAHDREIIMQTVPEDVSSTGV